MPTPKALMTYDPKMLEKSAATAGDEPAALLASRQGAFIEPRLAKQYGVHLKLAKLDAAKAVTLVQKSKKPFEWVVTFKAPKLIVEARVGTTAVQTLGEFDLGSERDAGRRRAIIAAMKEQGVINASEATALNKAYPDYDRLKEIRQQLDARKRELDEATQRAAAARKDVERLQAELVTEGG